MSVWGELKWTSDMYVPACRLLSFHVAVMPSFVVLFFCSKNEHVSEKSYNIHLWQFWKFPRRRVCLKKSIFGKENGKRSVTCGPNLSPWWLMSLRGLLKSSQGRDGDTVIFCSDHRHRGLYLSSRHVICMNNLGSLTDCGTYQGTVSQRVAAKMCPFLDFRTNCIIFPLFHIILEF